MTVTAGVGVAPAVLVPPHLTSFLEGVLPVHETSDMVLVIRIRRIIEGDVREAAQLVLDHMKMWYHDNMDATGQVFWSENHLIMSSSCDFLLREYLGRPVEPQLERRLLHYLDLKLSIGMAEFLSPVYLPFTITGLLNLYDYTRHAVIKSKTKALLDVLSKQVLSVVLPDGSFISPSGRSYARHREKTTEHHLSIFIQYLVTRQHVVPPPGEPEMALREACKSTTYLPSEEAYVYFKQEVVDTELPLSPSWRQLFDYLQLHSDDMTLEERVSTLWSHGAYFQPQAMLDVLVFMDRNGIWKHPHFIAASSARRMLCCCPRLMLSCFLSCLASSCLVRPYAMGALLTGASLAIHKEGKVLMASLTNGFNAGMPAFQQWPWTVNLAGVPIWCSFGAVGSGGLDSMGNQHASKELSTARVMPLMHQKDNVLSALYLSGTCVQAIWNRALRPRVRWRTEDFDEHGAIQVDPKPTWVHTAVHQAGGLCCCCPSSSSSRQQRHHRQPSVWRWARKDGAVIAQTVVGLEVTLVVRDLKVAGMTSIEEFLDEIRKDFGNPDTHPAAAAAGGHGGGVLGPAIAAMEQTLHVSSGSSSRQEGPEVKAGQLRGAAQAPDDKITGDHGDDGNHVGRGDNTAPANGGGAAAVVSSSSSTTVTS